MIRRRTVYGAALLAVAAVMGLSVGPLADGDDAQAETPPGAVRLNQIQTIGSHNSYHLVPSPEELALRSLFTGAEDLLMQYEHAPLPVQFADQAVRQIELDVFVDTAGGAYTQPFLRDIATPDADPLPPEMDQPGIKVLHVQDVDYDTTCWTLVACLQQVKSWSDANPHHVPLAVLVELKEQDLNDTLGLDPGTLPAVIPEPWTADRMNELDAEIRSVFGPDDMITPDEVRGAHSTLEEAILTDGWPTLSDSQGKVMFLMDNGGGHRTRYLDGHPSLAGRVLFTNASPGNPDAAFVKRNNPRDPSIPTLVEAGYVVRTRADAETIEARNNDTGPRDIALASGAQWVSTDYPVPNMGFGFETSYFASIPGGTVARCNPVNGPADCVSSRLETSTPDGPPPGTTPDPPAPTTPTTPTVPGATIPEPRDPVGPTTTEPSAPTPSVPGSGVEPPPAGSGGRDEPSRPGAAPAARPRSGTASYTG